jgi:hypothetical protein
MPEPERDHKQELFGSAEGPVITPLGAVKEGFIEFKEFMAPGLTWDKFSSEVGAEAKHMFDVGRSELANALFGHSAFVLYTNEPKNENSLQVHDGPEQTQAGQAMQQNEHSQQQERGLSM